MGAVVVDTEENTSVTHYIFSMKEHNVFPSIPVGVKAVQAFYIFYSYFNCVRMPADYFAIIYHEKAE